MSVIRVQTEDFNLQQEYQQLLAAAPGCGAVVLFTGLVRDFNRQDEDGQQPVESLTLQHYPGMTEKLIADIVVEAQQRWQLGAVTVIHRVGCLAPGDQIVLVGASSAHRQAAFAAAEFIMDYLKTRATFWKHASADGNTRWLDMHTSDQQAAVRWQDSGSQSDPS